MRTSVALVTSTRNARAAAPAAAATSSAPSKLMSATMTCAPSATNFLTMPAPNPDPPPVTMATLSGSLMVLLPQSWLDRHGLQHREPVQRLEALLAAVARVLDAAERQLDAAAGAVVVDEHLAALQPARHAQRPAAVARPYAGHQAIGRAVGDGQRLGLVVEGDHRLHRAEDLFLRQRCAGSRRPRSVGAHVAAAGGQTAPAASPARRCAGRCRARAPGSRRRSPAGAPRSPARRRGRRAPGPTRSAR